MHPVAMVLEQFRTDILESSDAHVAERHAAVTDALATSGPELDKVAPPPSKIKMTPEQFESAKAWRNTVIAHTERTGLKPIRVETTLKAMQTAMVVRRGIVGNLYDSFIASLIESVGECHHAAMDGDMVTSDGFMTIYDDGMVVRYVCRITQRIMPDTFPQWIVRVSLTRD